jgi:hypothetical protein
VFCEGGVQLKVAVPLVVGAPVTAIEKLANDAFAVPLLTLMTMPEKVPTLELVGVPLNLPVAILNVAQDGMF